MAAGDPHYLLYALQHALPLTVHYLLVMVSVGAITEFTKRFAG